VVHYEQAGTRNRFGGRFPSTWHRQRHRPRWTVKRGSRCPSASRPRTLIQNRRPRGPRTWESTTVFRQASISRQEREPPPFPRIPRKAWLCRTIRVTNAAIPSRGISDDGHHLTLSADQHNFWRPLETQPHLGGLEDLLETPSTSWPSNPKGSSEEKEASPTETQSDAARGQSRSILDPGRVSWHPPCARRNFARARLDSLACDWQPLEGVARPCFLGVWTLTRI